MKTLSRRQLLNGAALSAGAIVLAACQPKVVEKIVKETVVVTEEKVVEKPVEKIVEKEKVVEKTVVVEKAIETKILRIHWRLGAVRPHYKARMAEMEAAHPGLKLNSEEFPEGSATFGPKVAALVSAGVAGDVCWTAIGSGSFQFLAQYKALSPLDDMIAADGKYKLDDYLPQVVNGLKMGPNGQGSGEQMALPEIAHGTYQFLYVNKDALDAKGLKLPTDDSWGRDDLLDIAIKATDSSKGVFGFLPTTGGYSEIRHTTLAYDAELMSEDGKKSTIEDEGVKVGTQWIYDCFHKTHVAPLPAEQTGGLNQMFIGQQLLMFQSGAWGLETCKLVKDAFKWDALLMPKGPGGFRGGHIHADGFAVLSGSKIKDLAYEFCKLLTNHESNVGYAEFNGLYAKKDTYDDPKAQQAQPYWKILKQHIEEAKPHLGPANLRKQESQTLINALFTPLWVGDKQPDAAFFADASKQWQDFLDKKPE